MHRLDLSHDVSILWNTVFKIQLWNENPGESTRYVSFCPLPYDSTIRRPSGALNECFTYLPLSCLN